MSEAVTIRSTMVYIRSLFEQAALLLQAADHIVSPHGFSKAGTRNIVDTSATVGDAQRWIPSEAFQFYLSKSAPRVLLYVSVLFDDRYGEYEAMPDSLLTAGAFVHRKESWGKEWDYWWCRWHGFHEARKDDGTLHHHFTKDWDDGDAQPFEQMFTLGVLLQSVTTTAQLEAFLKPLLQALPIPVATA